MLNHFRSSNNHLVNDRRGNEMADQTTKPTEIIPSVEGQTSGIGSATAPVIFVDEFSAFGQYNGIVHITCEALRFFKTGTGVTHDRVVVAHLRMNLQAFEGLKAAIAGIDGMIADPGKNRRDL
jgi:hypothetical protein